MSNLNDLKSKLANLKLTASGKRTIPNELKSEIVKLPMPPGQSVEHFCKELGIAISSYYGWYQKYGNKNIAKKSSKHRSIFKKVSVAENTVTKEEKLVVTGPFNLRIEGTVSQIAKLLSAMRS